MLNQSFNTQEYTVLLSLNSGLWNVNYNDNEAMSSTNMGMASQLCESH